MKRIERNTYNSIRRNTTADTISVEIPVDYSHEARQAIHEYLTINGMRVTGINWNSIQECYCIHWEPARTETAEAIRRQQENADIDDVTKGMEYSDFTWNGYRKPAEAPQEAPAAEAEQQPTTTDEAPQAATQAAQERPQRIYSVYFTDHPTQAMTVKARTKREAEKAGRLYIRQWGLDASIDRIERAEA